MARRAGRRPGSPDTRAAVLAAAREVFAKRGFNAASIRTIATGAGVDPALVHHYFGTKEQLFLAALQVPINPAEVLAEALTGPHEHTGERLVRAFLRVWDSPAGTAAAAVLRSAMSNDWTVRLFREFLTAQVLRKVAATVNLDPAEVPYRVNLVATQMAGLAMIRYIVRLEPFASAPAEWVVAAVAPNVQRYISGEVPAPPGSG